MKLKPNSGLIEYSPTEELLNETFIAEAVWECLKNNDPEGLLEVIQIHLEARDKLNATKQHDPLRSSMLNAFKDKNPTIKTLAETVQCGTC